MLILRQMTRYLSEALGAEEPTFSLGIRQLEQASGLPRADIRLTTKTMQQTRAKLAELGLDPYDTTGPELYGALHQRIAYDEQIVRRALSLDADANAVDILSRVGQFVETLAAPKQCFALKASVAKRLFKKKMPKATMRRLGYRSLDSMLKHESVPHLFAAALIAESASWQRLFREQYAKLRPNDFEMRSMTLTIPQSKRWHELAASYVPTVRHNMLTFKELGAVVVLPMSDKLDGLAITSLLLAMHQQNAIRSYSSYIKLQQVKPHFGEIVRESVVAEPALEAQLAGQHVTWQTIHRYYAKFQDAYHPEVFEPHVQPEDLSWQQAEGVMTQLAPTLRFWQGTGALVCMHEGQPVSLNMLDVALGYCNHLSFADRVVHFVRDNLWHELLLQYLNHDNLETAVHRQLSSSLVEDVVVAE